MPPPVDSEIPFRNDLVALLPFMRAFARSLTRNRAEADDLVQDAMLRAWRGRAGFEPGTNMKAWTFQIVRNQFLSDKRRSWRTQSLDPKLAEESLVGTDDPSGRLAIHDLRRAMLELSEDHREALTLIGAAGMSYEEAAQICQVAVGTIKSRVSRARVVLQGILDDGKLGQSDVAVSDAEAAIFRDAEHFSKALTSPT